MKQAQNGLLFMSTWALMIAMLSGCGLLPSGEAGVLTVEYGGETYNVPVVVNRGDGEVTAQTAPEVGEAYAHLSFSEPEGDEAEMLSLFLTGELITIEDGAPDEYTWNLTGHPVAGAHGKFWLNDDGFIEGHATMDGFFTPADSHSSESSGELKVGLCGVGAERAPTSCPTSGGGPVVGSCRAGGVCTTYHGGDKTSFETKCTEQGNTFSDSACATGGGRIVCEGASGTSNGEPIDVSLVWDADYCSQNPGVDVASTCTSLGGRITEGTPCAG